MIPNRIYKKVLRKIGFNEPLVIKGAHYEYEHSKYYQLKACMPEHSFIDGLIPPIEKELNNIIAVVCILDYSELEENGNIKSVDYKAIETLLFKLSPELSEIVVDKARRNRERPDTGLFTLLNPKTQQNILQTTGYFYDSVVIKYFTQNSNNKSNQLNA